MNEGGKNYILPQAKQEQIAQFLRDQDENSAPEVINVVMSYLAETGASDVFFEPANDSGIIRARIDGVVHYVLMVDQELFTNIISRLKVMAGLDITMHTSSQEGKINFDFETHAVNARVALANTVNGEFLVLRLHDSSNAVTDITQIGLTGTSAERYNTLLKSRSGLLLVCGPTGSGKTSTLYSSLQALNDGHRNVVSIEDPVEYNLPGVNQMQVDIEREVTFAEGLKVILRLNPDIIFVGEIRDPDTAHISVEAALTGHLVMSTIHANSAISAISRLIDLNINTFFINSSLIGAISQRLVRKTCTQCGKETAPTAEEADFYQRVTGRVLTSQMVGQGCEVCARTGFKGRVAIFEVMAVDESIRQLITKGSSERQITQALIQSGYTTLLYDGMTKVDQKITTVREVISSAFVSN